MKRLLCIILACIMVIGLAACGKTPETKPTDIPVVENPTDVPTTPNTENTEPSTEPVETNPSTEPTDEFVPSPEFHFHEVYVPNANVDGFIVEHQEYNHRYTEEDVLKSLQAVEVLSPETKINSFKIEEGVIIIDFNKAFADTVCSMGSSGELMVIGSVANTFIKAFEATALRFTVDGEVLESGHAIYDFDLTFHDPLYDMDVEYQGGKTE